MKILKYLAATVITLFALTGCNTHSAYTFDVATGDKIKVKLNTTDGYSLEADGSRFKVKDKDGKLLSIGIFQEEAVSNNTFANVQKSPKATIIKQVLDKDPKTIFYKFENKNGKTQWDYAAKSLNAKAGIVIHNVTSEESALKVIELLSFEFNKK